MNKQVSSSSSSGGIGFVGALTVLFVGLKLTGHIDWTWTWVLSPIWITAIVVFTVIAGAIVLVGLSGRK
jgi:hypothetical protein